MAPLICPWCEDKASEADLSALVEHMERACPRRNVSELVYVHRMVDDHGYQWFYVGHATNTARLKHYITHGTPSNGEMPKWVVENWGSQRRIDTVELVKGSMKTELMVTLHYMRDHGVDCVRGSCLLLRDDSRSMRCFVRVWDALLPALADVSLKDMTYETFCKEHLGTLGGLSGWKQDVDAFVSLAERSANNQCFACGTSDHKVFDGKHDCTGEDAFDEPEHFCLVNDDNRGTLVKKTPVEVEEEARKSQEIETETRQPVTRFREDRASDRFRRLENWLNRGYEHHGIFSLMPTRNKLIEVRLPISAIDPAVLDVPGAREASEALGYDRLRESQVCLLRGIHELWHEPTKAHFVRDTFALNDPPGSGKTAAMLLAAVFSVRQCQEKADTTGDAKTPTALIIEPRVSVVTGWAEQLSGLSEGHTRKEVVVHGHVLGRAGTLRQIGMDQRPFRWMVLTGEQGWDQLRSRTRPEDFEDVDFIIVTAHKLRAAPLPSAFVRSLVFIGIDEPHLMNADSAPDLGVTVHHLLSELMFEIDEGGAGDPLAIVTASATLRDIVTLTSDISGRPCSRIEHVLNDTPTTIVSHELGMRVDDVDAHRPEVHIARSLGVSGSVPTNERCVFVLEITLPNARQLFANNVKKLLDRNSTAAPDEAVLLFIDDKKSAEDLCRKMVTYEGQSQLFYTFNGDMSQEARTLASLTTRGRTGIASSAFEAGVTVPNCVIVMTKATVLRNQTQEAAKASLIQRIFRIARSAGSWGLALVVRDSDEDALPGVADMLRDWWAPAAPLVPPADHRTLPVAMKSSLLRGLYNLCKPASIDDMRVLDHYERRFPSLLEDVASLIRSKPGGVSLRDFAFTEIERMHRLGYIATHAWMSSAQDLGDSVQIYEMDRHGAKTVVSQMDRLQAMCNFFPRARQVCNQDQSKDWVFRHADVVGLGGGGRDFVLEAICVARVPRHASGTITIGEILGKTVYNTTGSFERFVMGPGVSMHVRFRGQRDVVPQFRVRAIDGGSARKRHMVADASFLAPKLDVFQRGVITRYAELDIYVHLKAKTALEKVAKGCSERLLAWIRQRFAVHTSYEIKFESPKKGEPWVITVSQKAQSLACVPLHVWVERNDRKVDGSLYNDVFKEVVDSG
jgi:hypothetical protein